MLKWNQDALGAFKCNQEDATMGRIPGISCILLNGLGLPTSGEEKLLWRSSLGSDNQKVITPPEAATMAFMGGLVYSVLVHESSGFSKLDYEKTGPHRGTGCWYPAYTPSMNMIIHPYGDDMAGAASYTYLYTSLSWDEKWTWKHPNSMIFLLHVHVDTTHAN